MVKFLVLIDASNVYGYCNPNSSSVAFVTTRMKDDIAVVKLCQKLKLFLFAKLKLATEINTQLTKRLPTTQVLQCMYLIKWKSILTSTSGRVQRSKS